MALLSDACALHYVQVHPNYLKKKCLNCLFVLLIVCNKYKFLNDKMLEVTYFEKIGIVIFSRCSLQIISVKNVS
jgi:hypothetical protein